MSAGSVALDAAYPTYVHWGNTGGSLLANYHRDHAYAFDCTRPHRPYTAFCHAPTRPRGDDVRAAKAAGDDAFYRDRAYHRAVLQYETALRAAPGNAGLLASAAMAMLKRCACVLWFVCLVSPLSLAPPRAHAACAPCSMCVQRDPCLRDWPGDRAFALRACDQALAADPHHADAHYHKCHALLLMHQLDVRATSMMC